MVWATLWLIGRELSVLKTCERFVVLRSTLAPLDPLRASFIA